MDEYPVYEDDEDAIVVDNPRNSKAPTNLPKTEISSAPNQEKGQEHTLGFVFMIHVLFCFQTSISR